jgi:hypothetical protein
MIQPLSLKAFSYGQDSWGMQMVAKQSRKKKSIRVLMASSPFSYFNSINFACIKKSKKASPQENVSLITTC